MSCGRQIAVLSVMNVLVIITFVHVRPISITSFFFMRWIKTKEGSSLSSVSCLCHFCLILLQTESPSDACPPSAVLSAIMTSAPHVDTCDSRLGARSSLWGRSLCEPREAAAPLLLSAPTFSSPSVHIIPAHTISSWTHPSVELPGGPGLGPRCQMSLQTWKREGRQRGRAGRDTWMWMYSEGYETLLSANLHLLLSPLAIKWWHMQSVKLSL